MSEIQFVIIDAKATENELIKAFEQSIEETLYPGDERRMFLLNFLPVIVGAKNEINETGKLNLLRYAKDEYLDAVGGATTRLPDKYSKTKLKWTLSAAQAIAVTVAKGKRATPDGALFFATIEDLVIPAGQTFGIVSAEATETGALYNGFAPDQINKIVDLTAFVASVTNTETSSGGADIEDDESYRERIRLAPDSISTAGPTGGYEYWAKTADANIADVKVTSPAPGVTKVSILMKNGELPSQSVLDAVQAALTPKNRRPQTDLVQTTAAIQDTYNIQLTYYISNERKIEESAIVAAVEDDGGAIDQYILWQKSKMNRAINPDDLKQLMLKAGAYKIDITSPVYTPVAEDHVGKEGTVTITYGGLI
jgi:phage-related baseplate assembly protein